jgi:hypothetical protein
MSRRKLPDLEYDVVEVTPELAEEWLQKNTFNRKRSNVLVDFYAEIMMADQWRLNGEPIIFDRTGKLQSGQHRLWACIEAETSFNTLVVWGTDPDAIYTVDTGRKRTMMDALTLRGEKDVAVLGSMLTWIWRWENNVMDQGGRARPSNVTLLKMLDNRPEIRDALHYAYRMRKGIKAPVALLSALFYEFSQIDADDAEAFFQQCATGENLSASDPAYAWRRWIMSRYLEASKPNQQTIAAITVKAWNAFRRHEPVKAFRWAGNEPFPEAV